MTEGAKRFGLRINGNKTKTMTICKEAKKLSINLDNDELNKLPILRT